MDMVECSVDFIPEDNLIGDALHFGQGLLVEHISLFYIDRDSYSGAAGSEYLAELVHQLEVRMFLRKEVLKDHLRFQSCSTKGNQNSGNKDKEGNPNPEANNK